MFTVSSHIELNLHETDVPQWPHCYELSADENKIKLNFWKS